MHGVRPHTHLVLIGFSRWSPRPLGPTLESVVELNSVRVHPLAKSGGGGGGADGENILLSGGGAGAPVPHPEPCAVYMQHTVRIGCGAPGVHSTKLKIRSLQLRLHKHSDCGLSKSRTVHSHRSSFPAKETVKENSHDEGSIKARLY